MVHAADDESAATCRRWRVERDDNRDAFILTQAVGDLTYQFIAKWVDEGVVVHRPSVLGPLSSDRVNGVCMASLQTPSRLLRQELSSILSHPST